jgi:hypothetical protein
MQVPNSQDLIQLSIERTQRTVYILCGLNIIIILSCSSYGCLYRQFCHTSEDINVPPYASHGFLPVLLISILLSCISYHSAKFIDLSFLGPLRFLLLTFLIIILGFTIAEFIAGLSLAYTDRDSVWEKLAPLAKDYYDDKDEMNKEYIENIIFIFVVQIVSGILILLILAFVWKLFSSTPQGYLPRPQGNAGDNFLHKRFGEMIRGEYENNPLAVNRNNPLNGNRKENVDRSFNESQLGLRNDEHVAQEIREDDDEHPLAPRNQRNPFLR